MNNSTNFNTDDILNEVNLVIKKGLETILKDYMSRYNLLEKTHKQIMNLPSVLNELNKDDTSETSETSETIDTNEDEPMFISIADMTKDLVNEGVKNIETKISRLEKNYDLILPIFDKIMKKIDDLNEEVKYIKKSPNEVKVIKCNDVRHDETRENIKLEIQEEEHSETEVDKAEEEAESEKVEEESEEADESEDESEEEEKVDAESESEEKVEPESEEEEKVEQEVVEEEVEAEEEEEAEEEVEEVEEEEDVMETESEEESEEEVVEVEEEEDVMETESEKEEEEEEEELFEIEIDDIPYCTNNEDYGFIFELTEDGDVGNKVGVFKEGEPFFYADEK